jgi:hypothetical protein
MHVAQSYDKKESFSSIEKTEKSLMNLGHHVKALFATKIKDCLKVSFSVW